MSFTTAALIVVTLWCVIGLVVSMYTPSRTRSHVAAPMGRYDVLGVGSRGRGALRALLGSVAARLARGLGVPVLLGAESSAVNDPSGRPSVRTSR